MIKNYQKTEKRIMDKKTTISSGNKGKLSITVDEWVIKKMTQYIGIQNSKYIKSSYFSSVSSFTNSALIYFISYLSHEQEIETLMLRKKELETELSEIKKKMTEKKEE